MSLPQVQSCDKTQAADCVKFLGSFNTAKGAAVFRKLVSYEGKLECENSAA
jgi:hypothetical protein